MLPPGRAVGGPVQAGQIYRVNEQTPNSEYFMPSMAGGILTVPQMQAALRGKSGGGGGQPVVVTGPAPEVNVIGAPEGTKVNRSADGMKIDVIIEQVVLKSMSSGKVGKALDRRGAPKRPAGGA